MKPMIRSMLVIAAILVLAGASVHSCPDQEPGPSTRVTIVAEDFVPNDGSYSINWPGPPRRPWTDADKEYYTVTVTLQKPAPCDFQLVYGVRWDRANWFDKDIGAVLVSFTRGVAQGTGQFWLVCTQKGKVKGSMDKDDNSPNLFLDLNTIVQPVSPGCPSLDVVRSCPRPEHRCNCY
jgi:hypothetical protein